MIGRRGLHISKEIKIIFLIIFTIFYVLLDYSPGKNTNSLEKEYSKSKLYKGPNKFYAQSSRGTLALLHDDLWTVEAFESGECHIINPQDIYMFIVNHRNIGASNPTYLKIEALRIFSPQKPIMQGIGIFRNKSDWIRENNSVFNPKKVEKWLESLSTQDFVRLHQQANITMADEGLGAEWHAQPGQGLDSSWEKRIWWTMPFLDGDFEDLAKQFIDPLNPDSKVQFTGKLTDVNYFSILPHE